MIEEQLLAEAHKLSHWERHKFMLLVGLTIVVSLFLVWISLGLYNSSGAAQLDLSRPGYKSVQSQVTKDDTFSGYPSTGAMNKAALDQFRGLYTARAAQATSLDSFGGGVMSDQALGIDDPSAPPAE
jgi:hypothetical protein